MLDIHFNDIYAHANGGPRSLCTQAGPSRSSPNQFEFSDAQMYNLMTTLLPILWG